MLAGLGVAGLVDDLVPVDRLRLVRGDRTVERRTTRPSYVVPRAVLDARLVDAARDAGAVLRRHRVRDLRQDSGGLVLDEALRARVLVGSDGARSVVRRHLGRTHDRWALALRGYAPVLPEHRGTQAIVFAGAPLAYAWSFDRGDGLANVGYGEVLGTDRPAPTRAQLLARLEQHLPGSTASASGWRGHHLPLSGARWRLPAGRVLLAGDAAGLVNPLTGEGIYYAVATGASAGRAAASAVREGAPEAAGAAHARACAALLRGHLRHTAAAARLCTSGRLLDAGLDASARHQRVFDDLVELGLARGRITPAVAGGLAAALVRDRFRPSPARHER